MSRHVFTPSDRAYSGWSFEPPLSALENGSPPPCPLGERLLPGDVVTSSGSIEHCSKYWSDRSIPGVLCLSRGTHGRRKGRPLYRCVPADRTLPTLLVPYTAKRMTFEKSAVDLYILFEVTGWTERHPSGLSTNTLGRVDCLSTTYAYLTHARGLHFPIQKLTRHVFNALRSHAGGKEALERELEQEVGDACGEIQGELITVDPAGASDLDDALTARRAQGGAGFSVSVAITDPSYWLDRLDCWGKLTKRTTTLYLPDEKRHMLPPNLSESLCSLHAGRPRVAIVLTLTLDSNGAIVDRKFSSGAVTVSANYSYEDPDLLRSDTYATMLEATKLANNCAHLVERVDDSHDVVAYWMIAFNQETARVLDGKGTGIFRCSNQPPQRANVCTRDDLPERTRALLRHWGTKCGGSYVSWADRREHKGIGRGDTLYAQSSSPIRRMCDLVNLIVLKDSLGIGITSAAARSVARSWVGQLTELNRASKAAARLQSECELLSQCVEHAGGRDRMLHTGVPLQCEPKPTHSTFCFRYTVHLVDLQYVVRVDTDEELRLLSPMSFSLHLFLDEASMYKKVRVVPV